MHWDAVVRDGKDKKRKFIEITRADKKQRFMYNQRAGVTKEQRVINAKKVAAQLRDLGIDPVLQQHLRSFGFGPTYAVLGLA
jgi:hypothetical protein